MKSIYKVVYSDIKDKSPAHLPITMRVNFRSFERAMGTAKRLHKQRRDVVVIERDDKGMIASWEFNTAFHGSIFDYNESRTDIEEGLK